MAGSEPESADGSVQALAEDNQRLRKINAALMKRIERDMNKQGGAFSLFVAANSLENQVRTRTRELSRALEDLEVSNRELKLAKEAADSANEAKSQFLANVSHEIRTPMNGVLGMSEILLGTDLDPGARKMVELIRGSADALLSMINDLLDFSKIEAGKLTLDEREFSVRGWLSTTVETLAEQARCKGLTLGFDVDDDLPEALIGDAGRLRQIVVNLLSNAIKFTHHGWVAVRVFEGPRLEEHDRLQLVIEVQDSGIGLSHSARGRIFEAFRQADGSTTRMYGGTGLGLAIVAQLARMMDGDVAVHSEVGVGSIFTVTAVVQRTEAGTTMQSTRPVPSFEEPEQLGLHVLVAEDNPVNRTVAVGMLERLGCRAVAVADGRAALAELDRSGFDLVLMDWHMPIMDGLEATRAIRERDRRARNGGVLPVIALTANAMQGDRERCLDAGMTGFLSKPFTLMQLSLTLGLEAEAPDDGGDDLEEGAPLVDADRLAELQKLRGGDEDPVRDLVDLFERITPPMLESIERAVGSGAHESLATAAHGLKSSSGQIGAARVAHYCEALERMGREGTEAGTRETLERLQRALDPTLRELRRRVAVRAAG